MSDNPTCGECNAVMTPENSTAAPEYFLCDKCAAKHGFKPRKEAGFYVIEDVEQLRKENQRFREALRDIAENRGNACCNRMLCAEAAAKALSAERSA